MHARTGWPEVESSQMVVAPNGDLLMRPEPGVDVEPRLLRSGALAHVKAGNPTYTVGAKSSRRLQADGPGALEDDSWEFEVSAEDAEGLLDQLEVAPDTQVFVDFGEGEDADGRRLASGRTPQLTRWQMSRMMGRMGWSSRRLGHR